MLDYKDINIFTIVKDKNHISPIRQYCIDSWKKYMPGSNIMIFDDNDLFNPNWEYHDVVKDDYLMNTFSNEWSDIKSLKDIDCIDHNGKISYTFKNAKQGITTDTIRLRLLQHIPNALYMDSDTVMTESVLDYCNKYDNWVYSYHKDKIHNFAITTFVKDKSECIQNVIEVYTNEKIAAIDDIGVSYIYNKCGKESFKDMNVIMCDGKTEHLLLSRLGLPMWEGNSLHRTDVNAFIITNFDIAHLVNDDTDNITIDKNNINKLLKRYDVKNDTLVIFLIQDTVHKPIQHYEFINGYDMYFISFQVTDNSFYEEFIKDEIIEIYARDNSDRYTLKNTIFFNGACEEKTVLDYKDINIFTIVKDKNHISPIRQYCIDSWKKYMPGSNIMIFDDNDLFNPNWEYHDVVKDDYLMNTFSNPDNKTAKPVRVIDGFGNFRDNWTNVRQPITTDTIRLRLLQHIPNALYMDSDTVMTESVLDYCNKYDNFVIDNAKNDIVFFSCCTFVKHRSTFLNRFISYCTINKIIAIDSDAVTLFKNNESVKNRNGILMDMNTILSLSCVHIAMSQYTFIRDGRIYDDFKDAKCVYNVFLDDVRFEEIENETTILNRLVSKMNLDCETDTIVNVFIKKTEKANYRMAHFETIKDKIHMCIYLVYDLNNTNTDDDYFKFVDCVSTEVNNCYNLSPKYYTESSKLQKISINDKLKLSIYVITHNLIGYFQNILEDISKLDTLLRHDSVELVVLDCSDEKIRTEMKYLLDGYSKSWKNTTFKYIPYYVDPGIYTMRIDAVEYCSGDYIANCDGDDNIIPEGIVRAIEEIKNNNYPDIYDARSLRRHIDTGTVENGSGPIDFGYHKFENSVLEDEKITSMVYVWNRIVKSDVYKKGIENIPKFDHAFCEDHLMNFLFSRFAKTQYGSDNIIYIYNMRKESSSHGEFFTRSVELITGCDMCKIIYNIIDSEEMFKNNPNIFENVRRYYISRLLSHDRSLVSPQNKCLSDDRKNKIINNIINTYSKESWDIATDTSKSGDNFFINNWLLDKYGPTDISHNPTKYL